MLFEIFNRDIGHISFTSGFATFSIITIFLSFQDSDISLCNSNLLKLIHKKSRYLSSLSDFVSITFSISFTQIYLY